MSFCKSLILIFTLLPFNSAISKAQGRNLIINGGFEKIYCDSIWNTNLQAAVPWQGPAADLYVNNSDSCDETYSTKLKAFEGSNMIGFTFNSNGNSDIISVKLEEQLTKGARYKLHFAYLPNKRTYPKYLTINYCFAEYMDPDGNSPMVLNDTIYCSTIQPTQIKHWGTFETYYEANGTENYFLMYSPMDSGKDRFYYFFLDAFSLVPEIPIKTIR